MIGTIIFILCVIYYIIKKNLYNTVILGLTLALLIGIFNLNYSYKLLLMNEISIIPYIFLIILLIISLRKINDTLNYTILRQEIQIILDKFLRDKKNKIFLIIILAFLMFKTPLMSIIILIFIAIFLRLSKINMILLPFVSILTANVYNLATQLHVVELDITLILLTLVPIYFIIVGAFLVEKEGKYKLLSKGILIDVSYYIILFIINIVVYVILLGGEAVAYPLLLSMFITFLSGQYIVANYSVFKNQEIKEQKDLKGEHFILSNTFKLPYLMIVLFILSYVIGYFIFIYSKSIGIIYFTCLNFIFTYLYNDRSQKDTIIDYVKIIFLLVLVSINYMLIKENIIIAQSIFVDFDHTITLDIGDILLSFQNFAFFPLINYEPSTLTADNIYLNKFFLNVSIQSILSFYVLYIVKFIYRLEKKEIRSIIWIGIAISIILQIIVFIV